MIDLPMLKVPEYNSGVTASSCGFWQRQTSANSRNSEGERHWHEYATRAICAEFPRRQLGIGSGEVFPNGNRNGLGPSAYAEFAVATGQMGLHGARADEERLSNLGI